MNFQISASVDWVATSAGRVRYISAGSGPPLVLVHGLVAYAFSWRLVVPALSQHFKIYALDMPGSGFSDCPPELDFSLQSNAERLLEILDMLKIGPCDLLATSYGGAMAMVASAMAPARIRRLVLAAPVNPWSDHGKLVAPLLSHSLVAPAFLRVYPWLQSAQGRLLRRLFGGSSRIPPDSLQGYAAALSRPGVLGCALKTIHSWNRDLRYLEQLLPRIRHIPTLLLWGRNDRAVTVASAARLAEQFSHSKLVVFEGVGHLPYEEVPEEFTRAVLEFLC